MEHIFAHIFYVFNLCLQVGDEIMVTAMNIDGQWEGECRGKRGLFPFTHVQFVDTEQNGGDDDTL